METIKHFSHTYGLVFQQTPQASEIHCSGCKSPASSNVYACWQCNYFLHERCFRAARSIQHPSHPLHTLTLMPSPTYPSGYFSCNSCNLNGDGYSYSCSECEFDMHVHCALMHTSNPHLPHSGVPASNFSIPNAPQNSNSHLQNPIYPTSTYPPQNTTNPNVAQNYPPKYTSYPSFPNNPFPQATHDYKMPQYTTSAHPPNQNNPFYPNFHQTEAEASGEPTIVKHFSHPHAMNAVEFKQKDEMICDACLRDSVGSAYYCAKCDFGVHKECLHSPLPSKEELMQRDDDGAESLHAAIVSARIQAAGRRAALDLLDDRPHRRYYY